MDPSGRSDWLVPAIPGFLVPAYPPSAPGMSKASLMHSLNRQETEMFHNFESQRPLVKRRKVSRACDFCRVQRVRCDVSTPCTQCVANKVACSRLQPSEGRPNRKQPTLRRAGLAIPQNSFEKAEDSGVDPLITPQETPLSAGENGNVAPRDTGSSNTRLESMLGFISRLNAFCSGISQGSQGSPTDDPPPTYTSPFSAELLHGANPTECDLSPAQVERLLQVFWARLHPMIPILSPEDLKSHPPLRDAVTAYAMQYVFYSGLHSRLLGFQWKQFSANRCSRVIGMAYLQRCLANATQYSIFSEPSLPILQCFCIMTLYLLDAGQHQAAYNMIGLAVRMARSLSFDNDAPAGASLSEMDLTSRIWWTLVHLDFRCSRHLGKPFSAQLPLARSRPPCRLSDSPPGSDYFPYHTQSIQLTYLALGVIDSIARDTTPDGAQDTEAQAQALTRNLWRLDKWRNALRQHDWFQHLRFGVPEIPPLPEPLVPENPNTTADYMNQPPLQHQLSTMLELQYRDIIISLHRVFIQFPTPPLVPRGSLQAEDHASTALKQSLATIKTVHRCMSQTDLFVGSCEIYQFQWNAVLTLMGFMLAYPLCYRCPTARGYVDLALETFEFAGPKNDIAVRSAALTRHLCAKVDKLTMGLNIDLRKAAEPSAISDVVESEQTLSFRGGRSDTNVNTNDLGMGSLPDLGQEGDGTSLWSWVDLVDPSAWPSYCDEVNQMFTGGPEADLFQNAFYA